MSVIGIFLKCYIEFPQTTSFSWVFIRKAKEINDEKCNKLQLTFWWKKNRHISKDDSIAVPIFWVIFYLGDDSSGDEDDQYLNNVYWNQTVFKCFHVLIHMILTTTFIESKIGSLVIVLLSVKKTLKQ